MSEHTPGPWLLDPVSAWVVVPDRDAPICALLWPTELRSEDETFANARLIAAAPDLLEALEGMVRYAESVRTTVGMGKNQQARFDRAKALISRATGAA